MGDLEMEILDSIFKIGVFVVVLVLELGLAAGALYVMHFLLTLPLRRAERTRLFLDFLESTVKQGRPLEETIISLAQSRDLSMGMKFHELAAWLETGLGFEEALARVPRFLPPQVMAMLRAGKKIGDLAKVLPACRQLLTDAISQTQGAMHYLVILTFVITPISTGIFIMFVLKVIPRYMDVAYGMGFNIPTSMIYMSLLSSYRGPVIILAILFLLSFWAGALIYAGGPRVVAWFPMLEKLHYRLPWRRRRMQRDFSTMLAVLLDAGVPEPEALSLAADCSANSIFRHRAAKALAALQQGVKLPEAVQAMDDAGEFRWRLRNAAVARGGFLRALAGWHESLDARAFQQEQAAAHGVTTLLVLGTGLFVGGIAIAVFSFFTSIITKGALW